MRPLPRGKKNTHYVTHEQMAQTAYGPVPADAPRRVRRKGRFSVSRRGGPTRHMTAHR